MSNLNCGPTLEFNPTSLATARNDFRRSVQVKGGNKQKLSELDNLFALTVGYTHGFGNLNAASEQGYSFNINEVDIGTLVRYEVEHITCACGVEAYLNLYLQMGLPAIHLSEFVQHYMVYKSIFTWWHTLTSKDCTEILSQSLTPMICDEKSELSAIPQPYNYHPRYGLMDAHLWCTVSLEDLNLQSIRTQLQRLYQRADVQKGILNIRDELIKTELLKVIDAIRQRVSFLDIVNIVVKQMAWVNHHQGLLDVRAYLLYFAGYDTEYALENLANKPNWDVYLIADHLVLKRFQWHEAVCLTKREAEQVRRHFQLYGTSEMTQRFVAQLFVANKEQGSGTLKVTQTEWDATLSLVTASLRSGEFMNISKQVRREFDRAQTGIPSVRIS